MWVMANNKPKLNIEEPPIPDPDGNPIYYLTSRVPLHDEKGNVVGVAGVSIDITERKKLEELKQQIKIEEHTGVMKILSSSIAHELRTPLAGIKLGALGIAQVLPHLLDAYKIAKDNNLPIVDIKKRRLNSIESVLDNISFEVEFCFSFIDMLLLNVKSTNKIDKERFEKNSMVNIINSTLKRYPFKQGELNLVEWIEKNDFNFRGDQLLVTHVLFNLLKNAIYYTKAERKGKITIWFENFEDHNELHFRDTAKGIPAGILPHIFDRFFSRTEMGTGIGLSFCKNCNGSS